MKYPINLVSRGLKRLNLDGQPIEVIPCTVDNNLRVLTDALLDFEPGFDLNIISKSQISKMPRIAGLLARPENFRLSDYTLQYIL